jgi:hypothetical protein
MGMIANAQFVLTFKVFFLPSIGHVHLLYCINSIALQQQLSLHGVVPAPNTILNGINKVKPATTLSIDSKGKISTNI